MLPRSVLPKHAQRPRKATDVATERPAESLRRGATHGQAIDSQSRLTYAHRNILPLLAAGTHAFIEFQIVAHHRNAGEHVRTVADQRGAPHGRCDLAILDQIGFARRENEFTGSDVDLHATEVATAQ